MKTPKVYSYSRISSAKQAGGTGIDQQTDREALEKVSIEYGLPIADESFSDVSSGYHAKHLDGDFGRVLGLIESGGIAPESILVVSNLDRLSRQTVNEAMAQLLRIINAGVRVYTSIDGKLYSKDDANLTATLIVSLIYMERANEESQVKAKRTLGNALSIIKEGARDADGYHKAVRSIGRAPWYLDVTSGFVRPHKYYFPIAQEIVGLVLQNQSIKAICRYLNSKYEAPKINSNRKFVDQGWSDTTIRRFHLSKLLTGEQTFTIEGAEYVISDYAPAVCSESEFYQMAAIRSKNARKSGNKRTTEFDGLLNGIGVLTCGWCGGSMTKVLDRHQKVRYRCANAFNKADYCKGFSVKAELVEDAVIRVCADKVWTAKDSGTDATGAIQAA